MELIIFFSFLIVIFLFPSIFLVFILRPVARFRLVVDLILGLLGLLLLVLALALLGLFLFLSLFVPLLFLFIQLSII